MQKMYSDMLIITNLTKNNNQFLKYKVESLIENQIHTYEVQGQNNTLNINGKAPSITPK